MKKKESRKPLTRKSFAHLAPVRKHKIRPFHAIQPFLALLILILLALAFTHYVLGVAISPLAFLLLVAVLSMTATAILYAYDVHAREPEDEDWEAQLRQDLKRSKERVKESNRHVYQYLG